MNSEVLANTEIPWTSFMDMNSGGSCKLSYSLILIQAPIDEAVIIFEGYFDLDPYDITCSCCGQDYSVSEGKSLAQITGYYRGCEYDNELDCFIEECSPYRHKEYITLSDYVNSNKALFIPAIV